jgi:aspartate 1-decarboxylase
VEYEGSLTLDRTLMDACGMVPYERVEVYDVDNGNRFATYLIEGPAGSGACCINGAAARLVEVGHKVILACYAEVEESRAASHRPKVVLVDGANRIRETKDHEGAGVRV